MNGPDARDIRFRVLVPVWGERYIRDFCRISLPALLADGNLPALARFAGCEVVFLTTRDSQAAFESSAAIGRIAAHCPHSFLFIDDLLPLENYGIILTVAYGRGIASLGDRQTSTYFVFLNADFVLSNGILGTVVDRIGKGFNAVLAPSLRCRQEDVVDGLAHGVSPCSGALDAAPDRLVALTLRHLHLTAQASVVNQRVCHHNAANQFLWRVDDRTVIGRFFLMFMLCIRPERRFSVSNGWCDYVLVPELVASGRYDVITDSDEGFILEMQARRGEVHSIRAGRRTARDFAERLSFWTTAHHRDYAARTVVFHAGPPPPNLPAVRAEADAFMAELFRHLRQPPTPHLNHPFWTDGVLDYQRNLAPDRMPPELPRQKRPGLRALGGGRGRMRPVADRLRDRLERRALGRPPDVSRLHHAFLDYANFSRAIAALGTPDRSILHLRASRPVDTLAERIADRTCVDPDGLAGLRAPEARFDGAVMTLPDVSIHRLGPLLRQVAPHCRDGAPILICVDAIDAAFDASRYTAYGDTLDAIAAEVADPVTVEAVRLVTAPERLAAAFRLRTLRALLTRPSVGTWIAAGAVGVPAFARLLAANLLGGAQAPSCPGICTSATILLRGPWRTISDARADEATRFDAAFYRAVNTDLAQAGLDPSTHYADYGWREGRDPSASFSTTGYLQANRDIEAAGMNPLDHFRRYGRAEGRNGWQR